MSIQMTTLPESRANGSKTKAKMSFEVPFGKRQFTVQVTFQHRSQLSITVHPDATVTASAPLDADPETIRSRLIRRADWIARQVAYFQRFQPLPVAPRFLSGETHYFLGRQYRLNVQVEKTSRVALKGAFFEIGIDDPDDTHKVGELLHTWQVSHAKSLFHRRLEIIYPAIQRQIVKKPVLAICRMKKRWGSCSPSGRISLNPELLKAPLPCIDYVIAHELCHLIHPHHDTVFFRLLNRIMPDWERRKARLEQVLT